LGLLLSLSISGVYVSSVRSTGSNGTPSGYYFFKSNGKYPSKMSDKILYAYFE